MEPYFRLIQSRLHPTPSGEIPIWVVYLIPHYRRKSTASSRQLTAQPSLPGDQSCAPCRPEFRNQMQNGERQVGGRGEARQVRVGPGFEVGAGPWVRSLTGGSSGLGEGSHTSHPGSWDLPAPNPPLPAEPPNSLCPCHVHDAPSEIPPGPTASWGGQQRIHLSLLQPAQQTAACQAGPPMNIQVSQQRCDMGRITPFYSRGN